MRNDVLLGAGSKHVVGVPSGEDASSRNMLAQSRRLKYASALGTKQRGRGGISPPVADGSGARRPRVVSILLLAAIVPAAALCFGV